MEEVLLESKKTIIKKVLPVKCQEEFSLDFLAKTGSSEGAELIILSMSCSIKKITVINSAGNGNATCLYCHLSGSQASHLLEHAYSAVKQPPWIY